MNDREILTCLQDIGWEERYTNKPYKKLYRFQVQTTNGWEYFYLERYASDAYLSLHPRFFDWRKEFRACPGVEIGGAKGDLKLKHADMLDFPTVKGRTDDDIPEFFPLRFQSKEALLRAIAVIANKANLIPVAELQNIYPILPNELEISKLASSEVDVPVASSQGKRGPISDADYLNILNRQRENGSAGERIVIDWEKTRLKDCGCSTPDEFVTHTSKKNVGAGFDIHSHWTADQERFIEVKTTASGADYFFMSENEKEVLKGKAENAYIYIVDLDSSGKDTGTVRTPLRFSETELEFEPVAYRVRWKK